MRGEHLVSVDRGIVVMANEKVIEDFRVTGIDGQRRAVASRGVVDRRDIHVRVA